jgi:hypothetical protein
MTSRFSSRTSTTSASAGALLGVFRRGADVRRTKHAVQAAPEAIADPEPVSLVDAALRVAAGRQLFTRTEVLDLLRQVEAGTRGHAGAAEIERIVAGVDAGSADLMMVSQTDLFDPLLDIRLVLSA